MGFMQVTATAAAERVATGSSASAQGRTVPQPLHREKAPSASSTMPMTAKDPTWESFRIRWRVSRSLLEKMASQQSRKPSRWMQPESSQGAAVRAAAFTAAGTPKASSPQARPHHSAPTTSPTRGRQEIIRGRAFSSQTFTGQGMAQNIPQHIQKAYHHFTMGAAPPCER